MKKKWCFFRRSFAGLLALVLLFDVLPVEASSGNISASILAESKVIAEQVESEGIVLLKNDNSVLPLGNDCRVNVFGLDAYKPKYGNSGSGSVSTDTCTSFYSALASAGISYNEALYNSYKAYGDKAIHNNEMPVSNIDFTQAKEYSDYAIVMIGRSGSEGSDLSKSDLRLSSDEVALVESVAATFPHVIVLFNTANIMEMGWLNDYESVEAAALIWTVGEVGMTAVAKMLSGEVIPSGHLADSIAYSIDDYPTTANFGNFKYSDADATFIEYEEGIYLGYRYFETFGVDVQYPFGYGLSYTTFDWENAGLDRNGDTITVNTKVTNTGAYAGKDVVQIYVSVPYIDGGVEKSAIQLASYVKTGLLAPGESAIYSASFDLWDISSYDMSTEAYILDAGIYTVYTSKDVKTPSFENSFSLSDKLVKKYDETTGVEIRNLFNEAIYDGFTVLSRSNPEQTMPSAPNNETCPIDISGMDEEVVPEIFKNQEAPTFGAKYDHKIYLQDVYQDPSLMDAFLDEFTVDEMIDLVANAGYGTAAVDRLGVVATNDNDGPASVKGSGGLLYSDSGVAWPTGACLAATWNDDLAYQHGRQGGIEANDIGTNVWYTPTANLHRNPMGGRNFEYYSEDPILTGRIAAAIVEGAQGTGATITLKHFVCNEQEKNRWGAMTFANEQTIREIYLRAFEPAIKEAKATGVMSAYSKLGKTWCSGNCALIRDLLRTEWGYDYYVVSDFSVFGLYGNYMNPVQAVYASTDANLTGLYAIQGTYIPVKLKLEYNEEPVAFGLALRECVEDILEMKMRSTAFKNYTLAEDTFRVEGETGDVVGSTNKGSDWVEPAKGASTGYVLCNLSKKGNVITWNFNCKEEGDYNISMALADTHLLGQSVSLNKEITMTLNGEAVNVDGYKIKGYGYLNFNNFDEYGPINVHLQEGTNTITWTVIGGDCPNVDYMDFTLVR